MDGKGTTTATAVGNVGPFNENELLEVTKKSVNVLGINYDTLDGTQKEAFIAQAIGALTGVSPVEIEKLHGKTEPAVAIEFRKMVLQEFKNFPKWDQDEFIAGYKYTGPILTTGALAQGAVRSAELQESRR
jgi:hypothetical protein